MATYAIGDIQGCFTALEQLLEKIHFGSRDTLWLAGDLVNRGPDNLSVLRFARQLGDRVKVVLGNHDLHLLAIRAGHRKANRKDTVEDVFAAPDANALLDWLQTQPLIVHQGAFIMSHAGLPHIWGLQQAIDLAEEVHQALLGANAHHYFANMYGNTPNTWREELEGFDRLRVITNYLTRMRFVAPNGQLDFESKQGPNAPPENMRPWFDYPSQIGEHKHILFGHWAALEGKLEHPNYTALDTGCVWGGCLSALRLEDRQPFQVSCH